MILKSEEEKNRKYCNERNASIIAGKRADVYERKRRKKKPRQAREKRDTPYQRGGSHTEAPGWGRPGSCIVQLLPGRDISAYENQRLGGA